MSDDILILDGFGAINHHGQPRVFARRDPSTGGSIELHLAVQTSEGSRFVACPVVLQRREPFVRTLPMAVIDPGTAQALMDELWTCGLRPTEGTGSAGALAATQAHLEDMRRLCFEFAGAGKANP